MSKPELGSIEAAKRWFDGKSEGPNGRQAPSFSGLGATRPDDEKQPYYSTSYILRKTS